jgi:hypothetical protein
LRNLFLQAPLQVYAQLLHERARQQRALLGAEEVEAAVQDEEAEGPEEDDAMVEGQADMLQQVKAANRERREKQRRVGKAAQSVPPPTVSGLFCCWSRHIEGLWCMQ